MAVEFFSWSTVERDQLRERLGEVVETDYAQFQRELEAFPDNDGEDRAETATYRSQVRARVRQWCEHFEIPDLSPKVFDQSRWVPAGVQSWLLRIDRPAITNHIVGSLFPASSQGMVIYRPKVLERANNEIMRWLASRPGDVDRVHHRTLEAIVAEVIRDKGWSVELTKRTRDGGYDILALRTVCPGFPIKLIVECKLFDVTRAVGIPMVDRLAGVALREGADISMLVTNSRFTSVAWTRWEQDVGRNLRLVDRSELFEWLRAYR